MSALEIVETPEAMRAWADDRRRAGLAIGCVPTMGYLHDGHRALIRAARSRADRVVMTLFVNPTQFAPHEDLARYPRDFEGDCQKAEAAGADAVYFPSVPAMYPEGYDTFVTVDHLSQDLEGAIRPTHFRGVATVVLKLFAATRPHLAVFGEKDYQQLKLIERMTRDLDLGVEIIGLPTVREPDGLARSSRNVYLNPDQRDRARSISRALFAAQDAVKAGERDPEKLAAAARAAILAVGLEPDYVAVRDAQTLAPLETLDRPARMLIAARAGQTRLIDNLGLQAG